MCREDSKQKKISIKNGLEIIDGVMTFECEQQRFSSLSRKQLFFPYVWEMFTDDNLIVIVQMTRGQNETNAYDVLTATLLFC